MDLEDNPCYILTLIILQSCFYMGVASERWLLQCKNLFLSCTTSKFDFYLFVPNDHFMLKIFKTQVPDSRDQIHSWVSVDTAPLTSFYSRADFGLFFLWMTLAPLPGEEAACMLMMEPVCTPGVNSELCKVV